MWAKATRCDSEVRWSPYEINNNINKRIAWNGDLINFKPQLITPSGGSVQHRPWFWEGFSAWHHVFSIFPFPPSPVLLPFCPTLNHPQQEAQYLRHFRPKCIETQAFNAFLNTVKNLGEKPRGDGFTIFLAIPIPFSFSLSSLPQWKSDLIL